MSETGQGEGEGRQPDKARMQKNTSISLDAHFATFIEEQVALGRYGSASDVVRAGLRLLEHEEAKLAALRNALIEGEKSGTAHSFDIDKFIAQKSTRATLKKK